MHLYSIPLVSLRILDSDSISMLITMCYLIEKFKIYRVKICQGDGSLVVGWLQ